jgi:prevent-host-death family protein
MQESQREVGVKELRENIADVLNDVAAHSRVVYVTSRGRRIAAIVPLAVVEPKVEAE